MHQIKITTDLRGQLTSTSRGELRSYFGKSLAGAVLPQIQRHIERHVNEHKPSSPLIFDPGYSSETLRRFLRIKRML